MRKIFSTAQIRLLDQYTIENEPISSIDLMERAASRFTERLCQRFQETGKVLVVCGPGNNGGDGLVVARLLLTKGWQVDCVLLDVKGKLSEDCAANFELLTQKIAVQHIDKSEDVVLASHYDLLIDALFGSGLDRPLSGEYARLVSRLNERPEYKVSIDGPSGLYADHVTNEGAMLEADWVISFDAPRLAWMFPENGKFIGAFDFVDIDLHEEGKMSQVCPYYYPEESDIRDLLQTPSRVSHKGVQGRAGVLAGNEYMGGAQILSVRAAQKAGSGIVYSWDQPASRQTLLACAPECVPCSEEQFVEYLTNGHIHSLGAGPGMGKGQESVRSLRLALEKFKGQIVLDADAINILAEDSELWYMIRGRAILTPHLGELKPLLGLEVLPKGTERIKQVSELAKKHDVVIVVKGANSSIHLPNGDVYFNSSGNQGMATAGSGDVLTGILTGLLAQKYTREEAVVLGVYLHGLAGDLALETGESYESLVASDLINHIGNAFNHLRNGKNGRII